MINEKWVDVSATLSNGMVHWPTDPQVLIYRTETIGEHGSVCNVTGIASTAHVGTHIDAPLHFFANGGDVASVDLDMLIGPAKIFYIKDMTSINYAEIKDYPIEKGDRILFKTRNSNTDWETEPFKDDYVYLATDAAEFLVERGIVCVGVDYLSLGSEANDPEVHKLILGVPIIIIEGLKLRNVDEGDYDMICLPLKIKGSDGGPARVIVKRRHP